MSFIIKNINPLSFIKRANLKKKMLFKQDQLTVTSDHESALIKQASLILREYGVVCIEYKSFCEFVDELLQNIEDYLLNIEGKIVLTKHIFEDADFLIQKKPYLLKNYHEIASYSKPVINLRSNPNGADNGMIDIFNVQKYFSDSLRERKEKLNILIAKILYEAGIKGLEIQNTNLYINKSVTCTRSLHIDRFSPLFSISNDTKVFYYLTDVSVKSGPFGYVPKSHKHYFKTRLNYLLNRLLKTSRTSFTDMSCYNDREAVKFIGSKGTVIISCQNGVHRGMPQESGFSRYALVDSFYN